MAKIVSITPGYYRVPLEQAVSDSMHGHMAEFELNTVIVRDADGAEGVGYTYTCGYNGCAIDALLTREFPALVVGEEADHIERLWEKVWWQLHYGGRGGPTVFALAAFDMALWDLKAKKAKLPLWNLLGGHDNKVSCYAGGIDLYYPMDKLLRQTEDNLAKGFRAIKMKVGRDKLSEDVERVKNMREFLGADFPLMVDANMKWTVDYTIKAAKAFTPFSLQWLEEPIIPDDIAGHARILKEGGIAIATGENLRTVWDFKHIIASEGVSFPEPDVTTCGGVTPFMKICHLAEAFNLPVTSHGAHDITVHLLSAVPNGVYLEAHGFGLDRYIETPLKIEEGLAYAPNDPGHGVNFIWSELDKIKA